MFSGFEPDHLWRVHRGSDAQLVLGTAADWLRDRAVTIIPTMELIGEIERHGQTYINSPDKAQWIAGQVAHFNVHSTQRKYFGKSTRGFLRDEVLAAAGRSLKGEEREEEEREAA